VGGYPILLLFLPQLSHPHAPTHTHSHWRESLRIPTGEKEGGWLIIAPWTDPSQERDWPRRLARHTRLPSSLCLLRCSPRWDMPVAANTFWFLETVSRGYSWMAVIILSPARFNVQRVFPRPSLSLSLNGASFWPSFCPLLVAKPVPSNPKPYQHRSCDLFPSHGMLGCIPVVFMRGMPSEVANPIVDAKLPW